MAAYVTVFEEEAPRTRLALAAWGGACFAVQGETVYAGVRMPLRNGQEIRVSRVGMAPVRIEVDWASLMTEKDLEEREREARRRDEPVQRAVLLGMLPVAAGLFGWPSTRGGRWHCGVRRRMASSRSCHFGALWR